MTTVTLMTYNILGGRHAAELAQVITALRPDLLLANESPKAPLIWRWQCARLSRDWEMSYVAGGRPAGSNLLVSRSRLQVQATGAWRIAQPLFKPRRGVVTASLRLGSAPFGFVGCHLSLSPQSRRSEVEIVIDAADQLVGPVVVAGDLNERPGGWCWNRLAEAGFNDAGNNTDLTFPSARPDRRIDALLVRGGAVREHSVAGLGPQLLAAASDHLPVLARLEL